MGRHENTPVVFSIATLWPELWTHAIQEAEQGLKVGVSDEAEPIRCLTSIDDL